MAAKRDRDDLLQDGVSDGAPTFLFTDIEGSTRLWETEPARMGEALARHDALCRSVVEANGGQLVKMIGDGMHAVFEDPARAVASAVKLQRGMTQIGGDCGIAFRMRCGLHAGVSEMRAGDYFGSAVNRAARIAGAAHGGQILLSQAVVDLARSRFGDGIDVLHLGRVRLRDLSTPVDIWQVTCSDLPNTFPALRSLDTTPNNLPLQVTSFVGREREIAEVRNLFGIARLLTLTGSGGCGKTRLALHVAGDMLDAYPDGVWLVELAALADAATVPQAVATVLGLREEPAKTLTKSITEHLRTRRVLLVLDNAEHLLPACAALADVIVHQCPEVSLLVSSREALGIAGESTYRVPSLSTPDPRHDTSLDAVARYESARLFIERARAQAPRFAVTEQNAPALASVCARLDGIPLALELAAARVRALSIEEVNARLDERFRLLTGGSRTALPRQQTLRSLIDWSYDLLRAPEQTLFRRLAVFVGGFTLDAAEQVCRGDGVDDAMMLDLVTSLVDKSLVAAETRGDATRYRLLETIRQYARERLLEHGIAMMWRDRHLAYFAALGAQAEPHLSGREQRFWLDRVEIEYDNVRAALAWASAADGDTHAGLHLAASIWRFWYVRGLFSEGRRWLTTFLADAREPDAARAKALNGAGTLAWQQTDHATARALYDEALAIWRALGDRQWIARTLSNLGNVAHGECDYPASRGLYEQSLALRRELDDRQGIADALNNLGSLAYDRGDYEGATTLYRECLAIRRELGDRWNMAILFNNLGAVADAQEDYASARPLFVECLEIFRDLGDRWGVPAALNNLGELAYVQGDLENARALYQESLDIRREIGDRRGITQQLNNLAKVALARNDPDGADALHRESLALLRELADLRGMAEALEGVARGALARARAERAACIFGSAERLRAEIDYPLRPKDRAAYDASIASLRALFPDAASLEEALRKGRAMSTEQAIAYALER